MLPIGAAFTGEEGELVFENERLRQELRRAMATINAIKNGGVDALIVGTVDTQKVFSEKTSDKIYRTLIEEMNEGAVTLDQEGIILYCNSYFARLLHQPLEKTIGQKIQSFIMDSCKEGFNTLLEMGNEKPETAEFSLSGSDGRIVPVLISINSLVVDDKLVKSLILTDLTNQHELNKALEDRTVKLEQINGDLEIANRDLTTFTYVSSHDLQEPLRKIQNFGDIILNEEGKNLTESGKHHFHRMIQSARRMQELIQDLLIYSQSKSSDRKFEATDLDVIVQELKEEYEDSIRNKQLIIDATDLCTIPVIRFQFRQLFQNLVSNSVKFSKANNVTHVRVKTEVVLGGDAQVTGMLPGMNYYHITYSDNGIGFDPQYNDYIFDVFKRIHGSEDYEGTGIGLAICKRIVENHKGIITATGELNIGATFDIYIPAA